MVDGIRHTSILGDRLIIEVNLAISSHSHILQQGITLDSAVDVGLVLLREVDNLSIATTLEVEHAIVIPSVLVITDKATLGIGRQSGLTGTRETEEDGGVLTIHIAVGRAVHGSDTLQGQIVVHHREHTLLHLTAIPSVDDYLLTAGNVEGYAGL